MKHEEKSYVCSIYTTSIGLIAFGICLRFSSSVVVGNWMAVAKYAGVLSYVCGWLALNTCLFFKYKQRMSRTATAMGSDTRNRLSVGYHPRHKVGGSMLKHSIFSVMFLSVMWSVFEFDANPVNSAEPHANSTSWAWAMHPELPMISCTTLFYLLMALVVLKCVKGILITLGAAILIVFAEYVALPFQRTNNICDGLGLPLLILGLFLLFRVFESFPNPKLGYVERANST